jgi:hypothetical protein
MFALLAAAQTDHSPALSVADALALAGLALAWLVYQLQRRTEDEGVRTTAHDALAATRDGLASWSGAYFDGPGYTAVTAAARARLDRDMILEKHSYNQVLRIPTEPLAALILSPEKSHVTRQTVKAANFALWRFGVFNQLVQQHTDFNARHAAEIVDTSLTENRRRTLADAAFTSATMIHLDGVGNTDFYRELESALEENIEALKPRKWWASAAVDVAALLFLAALALVAWIIYAQ